jgi:hypothetical protein
MEHITPLLHHIRRALPAVMVVLGVVGAGSTAMLSSAVAAPAHRGRPPGPTRPVGWPADVPVAPGRIQGSTASAGQWSLLLLVDRSAAAAHKSTVAFYVAHGFRRLSGSVVQKGTRRVTVVVENRDHSPSKTFVLIAVTTHARVAAAA